MQSWLLSCCRCRHESDSDLYCAFDPDVAHMLAGWGLDWRQTHCLGQAMVEVGLEHMWGVHDSLAHPGPHVTELGQAAGVLCLLSLCLECFMWPGQHQLLLGFACVTVCCHVLQVSAACRSARLACHQRNIPMARVSCISPAVRPPA